MSRIALEHGATIDKYIGDAIMIFFGDPESRGVEGGCARLREDGDRDAGARCGSSPPCGAMRGSSGRSRCRIGINTGYCTVGNFGSEDRMDYTIIGDAVNLASRLEHEAPPGSILISFETHALVKDEVRCEERGQIEVRGHVVSRRDLRGDRAVRRAAR